MNFFSEQDDARRHTRVLVILFVFAVITLIAITNVLVAVTYWLVDGQLDQYTGAVDHLLDDVSKPVSVYFSWQNFGKISLLVSGVIACAVLYKWLQIRRGGKCVAEALGGVRINPNTRDKAMKRILNVVEEMALAAGMPVPGVYLLNGEKGINAFAAGNTPADAVIGITQGALDQFNREQLQGVVAHEFSHILNGDMRLNTRMIALLHGIVFIGGVGQFLMRSGGTHNYHRMGRRAGDVRVILLGLALLVVGWLGMFFGGLIKAAISRQREFLADASAVQFTRNPKGIADALKIIGGYSAGSRVFSASACETSHMFISEAMGSLTSFDTHPPLLQRIKRIEPHWDGQFVRREMKLVQPATQRHTQNNSTQQPAAVAAATVVPAMAATAMHATASDPTSEHVTQDLAANKALPATLHKQIQDAFGACALVYALLLSDQKDVQAKQLEYIKLTAIPGLALQTLAFVPDVTQLGQAHRLPLLERAMPALKMMSNTQYKQFKKVLLLMMRADARFDVFEWCLYQLVRHYLGAEFEENKVSRPLYKTVEQVTQQYQLVLSTLAHYGHKEKDQRVGRAFGRGANAVGLYNLKLLPEEQCLLDDFIKAVNKLANCYPLLKPRLLKGLAQCVEHDGATTIQEKEMLSAIAAVMDCPLPQHATIAQFS